MWKISPESTMTYDKYLKNNKHSHVVNIFSAQLKDLLHQYSKNSIKPNKENAMNLSKNNTTDKLQSLYQRTFTEDDLFY